MEKKNSIVNQVAMVGMTGIFSICVTILTMKYIVPKLNDQSKAKDSSTPNAQANQVHNES